MLSLEFYYNLKFIYESGNQILDSWGRSNRIILGFVLVSGRRWAIILFNSDTVEVRKLHRQIGHRSSAIGTSKTD